MERILDELSLFAQEQWYVLLIAAIVLVLIIKIVKTMVKWVLVIAIAAGVLYYGANYTEWIKDVGGQVLDYVQEEALNVMIGETAQAEYTLNSDGTFEVRSKNVTISGRTGSDKVKIEYKGYSFELGINDTIRAYIEQAKENANGL